ncbi:hypothetical protein [Rhodococcus chondri]|uniref:Phospholipase A2 n=1 Tax=Rhodococcus chondri TaxID=3065941 RepID=A0ABU7JWE3_9NOCA|nr:hypothetical protein [Rhodococcus sp. CC-R104]MEE2034336.1 hypothetical protein [Rhodococcus sp. CC-R104]
MTFRSATTRAAVTVVLGAGAALCVSAAAPGTVPVAPAVANEAAAATVTALVQDDTATAAALFPDDFATVMDYAPVAEPGFTADEVLADPDGDCSSPVPLPEIFEPACRVHDLGYDLLRYARDTGGELEPQARRDLDAQLARNLRASCRTSSAATVPACDTVAFVASAVVRINSWRQGYRLPVSESPVPYLATAAALAASAAASRGRIR